jgi:thiamine biosynthesis lipoprotein
MDNTSRRIKTTAAVLLALSWLLAACSQNSASRQHQLTVFGTVVDITIHDADSDAAYKAITSITNKFEAMHYDWHAWKPGVLVTLNQAIARNKTFVVTSETASVINKAKMLARQSDDLFNPAIGQLIALWGFHADTRPSGPPPDIGTIRALVRLQPRMSDLVINGNKISSSNPAVQLDFGGFAKGVAVDRAIEILMQHGINNAIVNAGGDLRAIGRHGDRLWRVGIRHPGSDGIVAAIETEGDESVFTSGNYERYREHMDRRYAHIIDPRDGMPIEHVTSATVIHGDGATADAAATALVVAGPKHWHRIAKQMGIKYAMLIDEQGNIYANPAMLKRLKVTDTSKFKVITSKPL